jgi:recombination protein RecT
MTQVTKTDVQGSIDKQNGGKLPIINQTTLHVVKGLISKDEVKKRFEEIMGQKAGGFIASITSLVSSSTNFDGTDATTIISSAIQAATLDLPINPNLGFAWIIPYWDGKKKIKVAQFQLGYKGFLQLAMRTSHYKTINVSEVYRGDIKKIDRFTGQIEFNTDNQPDFSKQPLGYVAYFRLLNGFEKYWYLTRDEVLAHAKRFSKTYSKEKDKFSGQWEEDFDGMAKKTTLKLLLSKYGILSVQLQQAIQADQAVVKEGEGNELEYEYPDAPEAEEVKETPAEDFSKFEKPEYWIGEIESVKEKTHWSNWKKKHLSDLEQFSGEDRKKIDEVFYKKEKEFTEQK